MYGGRGRWKWSWIYRRKHMQAAGSNSSYSCSSSSGTIVSATTHTSRGSRLSSVSIEAAMLSHLELSGGGGDDDEHSSEETVGRYTEFLRPLNKSRRHRTKEEKMKHMVQEFFGGAQSASCVVGDMSVLERWLKELGVAWVLQFPASDDDDDASPMMLEQTFDARSWILALTEIKESVHVFGFVRLPNICEEELEAAAEGGEQPGEPDQLQIAQFFQQVMLKMLGFVDAIAADGGVPVTDGVPVSPHVKLSALLLVHDALSKALSEFRSRPHPPSSAEAETIESEMASLLSAKQDKVRDAIWSRLEGIRTRVLEPVGIRTRRTPEEASSDVHRLTWSVMRHVTFLLENFWVVFPILSEASRLGKYVPQITHLVPFDSMIMEMATSLEEKLLDMSESFPDQGLKFLFLINNLHFMRERIQHYAMIAFPLKRFDKIEAYKERYLQTSWVPVSSCLSNPTPLCFVRNFSQLSMFESEFEKTYNTQKLWKVPDPELRKRLRNDITERIVPGYAKYIDDNKATTPKFTPQELEEMLQELFEG